MKRAMVFLLVFTMLPLFMGAVCCPCASASVSKQVQIQRTPCHGCCPEMTAAPDCQADFIQKFEALIPSEIQKFISASLKALSPRESRDIAINRPAYVRAGDEPLFTETTPLYLSIQVLRI